MHLGEKKFTIKIDKYFVQRFLIPILICSMGIQAFFSSYGVIKESVTPLYIAFVVVYAFYGISAIAMLNKYLKYGNTYNQKLLIVSHLYIIIMWLQSFFSNSRTNKILIIYYTTFAMVMMVTAFYLSSKKTIDIEHIIGISFLCLLAYSIYFIYIRIAKGIVLAFEITNSAAYENNIYYAIIMLPIVCCSKRRYVRLASMLLVTLDVIMSFKQTAFLAIVLGIMAYVYINNKDKEDKRQNKMIKTALILLAFVIFVFIASIYVRDRYGFDVISGIRMIGDDGGSGRFLIYSNILKLFTKSSFFEILMGHGGYGAVTKFVGIAAHNDFLEVLFDFGLIGFTLYIAFIYYLVRNLFRLVNEKYEYAPSYGMSMAIFFSMSMFSSLITNPSWFTPLAMFIGIALGNSITKVTYV